MADEGISVAPCLVSTSSRTLTNSFGKSARSLLSKDDRALDCSGCRINLVVERDQRPRGYFFKARAVKGIYRELGILAKPRLHLTEIVLGNRKNNGDGLHLRDDHKCEVPDDWTTLPGSTSRKPTLPANGAVMWQ